MATFRIAPRKRAADDDLRKRNMDEHKREGRLAYRAALWLAAICQSPDIEPIGIVDRAGPIHIAKLE